MTEQMSNYQTPQNTMPPQLHDEPVVELNAPVDSPRPFVSAVMPCRNEAAWIVDCLNSVLANDYPKDRFELILVDGMSTDETRQALQPFLDQYRFIRLLDNPRKITPSALNIGIEAARGEIVMRIDAHYEYPPNYVSRLVHCLEQSGADNVGGVVVFEPANQSSVARAIAAAVAHPFGIGNAYYRIGASESRWVDTVPFGCYRRQLFERIGRFDEELVRNQDIEFNLRLRKAGGSILLVPDIVLRGRARDSLGKMARTYYQYGYFNPLVIRKLGERASLRQVVTPLFAISLIVAAALSPWLLSMRIALAAILVAYSVPLLACSTRLALKHGLRCGLWLCLAFPVLHISHGLGFLRGLLDFVVLRRNTHHIAGQISLTR